MSLIPAKSTCQVPSGHPESGDYSPLTLELVLPIILLPLFPSESMSQCPGPEGPPDQPQDYGFEPAALMEICRDSKQGSK